MKRKSIPPGEITQGSITRVLVMGFTLVIVLLVFGGSIAIHNIISIQDNAAKLVTEQRVARHLIEKLLDEQKTLSAIFYTLAGDPDTADSAEIARNLDQVDASLQKMETEAHPTAQEQELWGELLGASHAFAMEAQRLLAERAVDTGTSTAAGTRDLFRKHEEVVFIISRLVGAGFQRVAEAETEIDERAGKFNFQSLTLLCASLGLALVCSVFTVRATRSLFRRMAWQEGELTRVSWHMLAHHETIARRFSHELHDELGQTLAALRSNLTALEPAPGGAARLADSTRLLDDAIGNVRQLSQLLRPMILDDFGLDAGLGWLCEGFMHRTGIEVDYQSDLHCRLADLTETHLFRIAQEALTNIARHSGATQVKMQLRASADEIRLTVADNGKGLAEPGRRRSSVGTTGMGMTGMRARTRAVGGTFRVSRPEEGGLKLEVRIPFPGEIRKEEHEADPDFVGR